jgi:radical SAM enzyme (TIGR01210 family)
VAATPREQILAGAERAEKTFGFSRQDPARPAQWWFQESAEGLVLFVVFYTLACRWNRCTGCNLPALSSLEPIGFRDEIAQIEHLFAEEAIRARLGEIDKLIVSNNGSVLDEVTFAATSLMALLARINLDLPALSVLSIETRPEYVDWDELAFISRALAERERAATLELAIGFEAFDERIRNEVFVKGLTFERFERLLAAVARHGFRVKCYLMQKPVAGMTNEEAVEDVRRAIDYLDECSRRTGVPINLHLNPTFVARGTPLAAAFERGEYTPPALADVAQAVLHARNKAVSVFVGLFDEGLAVPGGSFLRPGDEELGRRLAAFNRTQDFSLLG